LDDGQAHGIHGDAWFGSARAAREVGTWESEGVFQVKHYLAFPPSITTV
jgi:hypothetical protein